MFLLFSTLIIMMLLTSSGLFGAAFVNRNLSSDQCIGACVCGVIVLAAMLVLFFTRFPSMTCLS